MNMNVEELLKCAMKLPAGQRYLLAERLMFSLEKPPESQGPSPKSLLVELSVDKDNMPLAVQEEIHPVQQAIYHEMPPDQRQEIAQQLYWSAWKLKAAALSHQHPDWSEAQVQEKLKAIFMYAVT